MFSKLIITLAILAVGLIATQAALVVPHARGRVETLIPRQHVCCDPQTGGDCYWDDTPPPCEKPGSTVDHSGACCNGLSETNDELNAVTIKKSLQAHARSQPDANKANVEATVISKDGIDGKLGIDLIA